MDERAAPSVSAHRGPGRRAAGKARTHGAILAAAATVFAERGYGGGAIEEIARAAGVSVGSVYAHFGSKQDLFLAVLDGHATTRLHEAQSTLEKHGTTTPPLAAAIVTRMDDRRASMIDAEAWLYTLRHDDELTRRLREHFHDRRRAALRLVEQHRRRDDGMPYGDEELATIILAVTEGLARQRMADPGVVTDDLVARTLALLGASRPDEG